EWRLEHFEASGARLVDAVSSDLEVAPSADAGHRLRSIVSWVAGTRGCRPTWSCLSELGDDSPRDVQGASTQAPVGPRADRSYDRGLAGGDDGQILPGRLERRKVLATEHQTRVCCQVHRCQIDAGVSKATRDLAKHAGRILNALNDHFRRADDLVADLGDGEAGSGLVRSQQVEDDAPVFLDGAEPLDIDLLATQLLRESRKTALGVGYGDGEVISVHD